MIKCQLGYTVNLVEFAGDLLHSLKNMLYFLESVQDFRLELFAYY